MICCINVEGDSYCMVRNDVNIIKLDVRWVKKFYFYVMVFDIFDVYVYWFSKFFF